MKKILIAIVTLSTISVFAKSDCTVCSKLDKLSKDHSNIKGASSEVLNDSADKALGEIMEFKFSKDKKVKAEEIKSLFHLLVSLRKDDQTGTSDELLDFYLREHGDKQVMKGFADELNKLPSAQQKEIREAVKAAQKLKRDGNA